MHLAEMKAGFNPSGPPALMVAALFTTSQAARFARPVRFPDILRELGAWITALQKEHEQYRA